MGVSLERVQFKFASIIGELCSEPLILSQFAVWVDLKMAEYKAKGAMSLECSGDKPEPTWMKGVIPPTPPSRLSASDHGISHPRKGIGVQGEATASRPSSFSPSVSRSSHSTHSQERLSPELIIVKEEPSGPASEAYPLSFHQNTAHSTPSRKRYSEDFSDRGGNKYKRTFPPTSQGSTDTHTTANQSLLSVIGEDGSNQRDTTMVNQPSSYHDNSSDLQVAPSTSETEQNWGSQELQMLSNSGTDFSIPQEDTSYNDKWAEAEGFQGNNSDAAQYYTEEDGGIPGRVLRLVCRMCNYHTPKAYNMRRHVLKHMPELRFKCPVCQKGYIDRYQLSLHARKKHPEILIPTEGPENAESSDTVLAPE